MSVVRQSIAFRTGNGPFAAASYQSACLFLVSPSKRVSLTLSSNYQILFVARINCYAASNRLRKWSRPCFAFPPRPLTSNRLGSRLISSI